MSQTIGSILTILGAIALVYLFLKFGLKVAEFGWWGAITAVCIAVGVFLLFTRQESPAFAVPLIDRSIEDNDKALQTSYTMSRLVEAFGGQPEKWSLNPDGGGNSNLPPSLNPQPGVVPSPSPQPSYVPPAVQPSGPQAFGSSYRYQMTTDTQFTMRDAGGTVTIMTVGAGQVLCVDGWLDPSWLHGCETQNGLAISYSSIMVGLPAYAPVVATAPPSQQPQYDTTTTNAAKANCWTTWASVYLVGQVEPGTMALPTGTGPWTLKAKGDWNNNFRKKANEVWFLSNAQLGIVDFVVNGWVGRSFSNANDSGSIMVYGANPNIWQECLALVNP